MSFPEDHSLLPAGTGGKYEPIAVVSGNHLSTGEPPAGKKPPCSYPI